MRDNCLFGALLTGRDSRPPFVRTHARAKKGEKADLALYPHNLFVWVLFLANRAKASSEAIAAPAATSNAAKNEKRCATWSGAADRRPTSPVATLTPGDRQQPKTEKNRRMGKPCAHGQSDPQERPLYQSSNDNKEEAQRWNRAQHPHRRRRD